jgi:Ca2+-binding EF-hand superfamily protein
LLAHFESELPYRAVHNNDHPVVRRPIETFYDMKPSLPSKASDGSPPKARGFSFASMRRSFFRRPSIAAVKKERFSLSDEDRARLCERFGNDSVQQADNRAGLLFAQLDNGERDGTVDPLEFQTVMSMLGANSQFISKILFQAVDRDGNESISYDEFLEWLLVMTVGCQQQKLKFGFNLCDTDRSGKITHAEMLEVITCMYASLADYEMGDSGKLEVRAFVDQLFHCFDEDEDGEITWEEYYQGCLSNKVSVGLFAA